MMFFSVFHPAPSPFTVVRTSYPFFLS
jgi:hypothetical protein